MNSSGFQLPLILHRFSPSTPVNITGKLSNLIPQVKHLFVFYMDSRGGQESRGGPLSKAVILRWWEERPAVTAAPEEKEETVNHNRGYGPIQRFIRPAISRGRSCLQIWHYVNFSLTYFNTESAFLFCFLLSKAIVSK